MPWAARLIAHYPVTTLPLPGPDGSLEVSLEVGCTLPEEKARPPCRQAESFRPGAGGLRPLLERMAARPEDADKIRCVDASAEKDEIRPASSERRGGVRRIADRAEAPRGKHRHAEALGEHGALSRPPRQKKVAALDL